MAFQQLANHMPESAGKMFIIQKTDREGNPLAIPPRFELSVMKIGFENVRELKGQYGKYAMPIDMVTGKETPKIKAEMFNYDIEQINGMFYGADVVVGGEHTQTDKLTVPTGYTQNYKIKNVISFFLGRWVSHTSAKIAGTTATTATDPTEPGVGKIGVDNGTYYFNKADVGKAAELTWVCVGDVTVVSTVKIPKSQRININAFNSVTTVKKGLTALTKGNYNPTGSAPASGIFQVSPSGVFILNSAEGDALTITHKTHGNSVTSVVDTLPDPDYQIIIDPPQLGNYVSTNSVQLITNTGTAMTGVAAGEYLAVATTTPTSGQFKASALGIHTFAAADVGDLVTIDFVQDYFWLVITPPSTGDFVKHLSVKIKETGKPLREMREVADIASLGINEYVVDGNGTLYFDFVNKSQAVFYSYLYHTDTVGRRLIVENHEMGSGVELEITITHKDGPIIDTISGIRAMAKHHKLDENEGDKAKSDVEFELYANDDGIVYTWSTNEDMV